MKCIFLSNVLDPEFANKNNINTISFADNTAQYQLILGLQKKYKDDLIIITPSYNDFTNYNHRAEDVILNNSIKCIGIKNNSKNKIIYYLTIIYNYYKELKKQLNIYQNEKIVIITNGSHIFRSLPVLLLQRKFKFKFVPFLISSVELPEYKGINHIIASYSKHAMKKIDGSITYVENNSTHYSNMPFVTVLFSLNENDIMLSNELIKNKKEDSKKTKIFFGGALTEINGIHHLIRLIEKSPDFCEYTICGDGDYKDKLIELQKKNPNKLKFLGPVSHSYVLELEHNSDYVIMLRDTDSKMGQYHSNYSLPSKIFEYMLSGTPIILNKYNAIPKELSKFIDPFENCNIDNIIEFLIKNKKPSKKMKKKALEGRNYIIKNATAEVQNKKIINFIEKIMKDK